LYFSMNGSVLRLAWTSERKGRMFLRFTAVAILRE
jgi:hypothetical protein